MRREQPILFEVLHVQADGDECRVVDRTDRSTDLCEPGASRVAAGRMHAVRILIAHIPRPECVVAGKRSCDVGGQESLGVRDERIGIPVAEPGLDHHAARDDSETSVAVRAAERPRRDPVHSAHVARKQRWNER